MSEIAPGTVVEVLQGDCAGDVGEVEIQLPWSFGVRIVQEESERRGQLIYFTSAQLRPIFPKER